MSLLHENETYGIIGSLMAVHRGLGPGLDELTYQDACSLEFAKAGMPFKAHPFRWVEHNGERVKELVPDFLLFDKIILELKVVCGDFARASLAQAICYAKLFHTNLAILANFGLHKLIYQRLPYTPQQGSFKLDVSHIQTKVTPEDRNAFDEAVRASRKVWELHGLGYTDEIYSRLIRTELKQAGVRENLTVQPVYCEKKVRVSRTPVMIVEGKFPLYICALNREMSAWHIAYMRTYLRWLSLPYGCVVHFGRKRCEMRGVCCGSAGP